MAISPVDSVARIGVLSNLYAKASEKGYSEFLETNSEMLKFGDIEYDQELKDLKHSRDIAGVQAIVFSAMTFEAAIYDFASAHLGDEYVREHLDRLDVLSKWLVVLRFVTGVELPKGEAPYAAFKSLILERNRLVHSKSEPIDSRNLVGQIERVNKRDKILKVNVHNSFRALVLMSLYLEGVLDGYYNPLPSYSKQNAPMRRYYSQLKKEIAACRNVVAAIDCS